MKVLLFFALAVGPALTSLAADSPAIDEADFTAAALPQGFKLQPPDNVAQALKAQGQPELAQLRMIHVVADETNSRTVTVITPPPSTWSSDDDKKKFLKGFVHSAEATPPLIKAGYKLVSNDGLDWDKADVSKPYVANMVFENAAAGKKVFTNSRVTFASNTQLITVVTVPAKSDLQPLVDWAESVKRK